MDILKATGKGIQDSIYLEYNFIKELLTENKIISILKKLLKVNFLIYYLSSCFYYYILPKFFNYLFDVNKYYYFLLVNIIWYLPIVLITNIINLNLYSEIVLFYKSKTVNNIDEEIKYFASKVFHQLCFLFINFSIQIIYYLPYIGNFLYIVLLSFFYSFYCYDYELSIYNIDYGNKIDYYEQNWAYYLGKGIPFALILCLGNTLESFLLISFLFPLLLINSLQKKKKLAGSYIKLPFFKLPAYLVDNLIKETYQSFNNK